MRTVIRFSLVCDVCGKYFYNIYAILHTGNSPDEFGNEQYMMELAEKEGWERRADVEGEMDFCPGCKTIKYSGYGE